MKISVVVLALAVAAFGVLFYTRSARATRGPTWRCDTTAARSSCAEWDGTTDDATLTDQHAACRRLGGSVSHEPCPTGNAVGSCGSATSRIVYYAPRDMTKSRKMCAMLGGTWR